MCVLVVEDDFLIRQILVEELEDAGYIVKQASSGDDALALLDELTAVLTDVHMLLSQVYRSWHDVSAIVTI